MRIKPIALLLALAASAFLLPGMAQAQIQITEVDAAGSASLYGADWFELKNVGSSAVNISGWKIDDNSSNFVSAAVALRGVTSIAAGQSVVFIEGNTSGSTDASIDSTFATNWFGVFQPSGLVIGNYGGAGVGLSQTTDAVNIFDGSGNVQAYVSFGASLLGATFDNTAGVNGTIATFSSAGVNGAFTSSSGQEVGSPDALQPVPEPASCALCGLGVAAMVIVRRSRKA